MKKKILIVVFIVVAGIQLYIPAQMIMGSEDIMLEGEAFKFETAPLDPSDPFRGKYLTLDFKATEWKIKDTTKNYLIGERVYATIEKDKEGFAFIKFLSKEEPSEGSYLKVEVSHKIPYDKPEKIFIQYPFDRLYMEESKAYAAEEQYRRSMSNPENTTYAVVHIKDGSAVISNIFINDVPLINLLEE